MPTISLELQRILLLRTGHVVVDTPAAALPDTLIQAVEAQLADLGYAPSTRLRERMARLPMAELSRLQGWLWETLAAELGADRKHVPLFRRFPEDVPQDTTALWWKKFLIHFAQASDQPCLFCGAFGTTHVLNPCRHVVCDRCFDGANYSACPACEHHVDTSSPFFKPSEVAAEARPETPVTFKRLDVCERPEQAIQGLFRSFCERKQPMSPVDREHLEAIVKARKLEVLAWLPPAIPVKETSALVFATLCGFGQPERVFELAQPHLRTATDVLRLLVAYSGEDPSLQGQRVTGYDRTKGYQPKTIKRFRVARMSRGLRRAALATLERMDGEALMEDMLRHRSYWVWLGEFLHPHEFARRFPKVARAFEVVRRYAPDGTKAEPFRGYASRLEAAFERQETAALVSLLAERPGELARRFDRALRTVAPDEQAVAQLLEAFKRRMPALSTPMLLALRSYLPTRLERAAVRIYWPKGAVARGVSSPDRRPTLPGHAVGEAVAAIEAELLRRFSDKPRFDRAILDEGLREVIVPFNERTAARSAVSLPRGSRVPVPAGKLTRLFLHWCQPERGGSTTDLDLSVAFYDAAWQYQGVCSYYELTFAPAGEAIAKSAGDLRDAPFPDGATEFVDIQREQALAQGIRYAVMVVNAYSGMPFNTLERAFAGLMLRDEAAGAHFDPRAVTLKFALEGENGVFMPLVLDLQENVLHWLDVYGKGQFQFNNVETSRSTIAKVCPEMITYFGSGVRPSMYDLALLHAAARAERVCLRGEVSVRVFERQGDGPETFLRRLRTEAGRPVSEPESGSAGSLFAALRSGDLDLPPESMRYCLFPGHVASTIAASDLLS